jgi:predicted GNAT superfamily acetyltransferase
MIRYEAHEGTLAPAALDALLKLHAEVFPVAEEAEVRDELARVPGLYTLLALEGDRLVGYKIGYRRKAGHFYSWLGGVSSGYRQRGIASALMERQHQWCRQSGYHTIRTQTTNHWRDMLIMNLRYGFAITGLVASPGREPKIVLEKKL